MARKIAIVTGGSRGIGRAIVDRLSEDGADVLTCGRSARPAGLPAAVVWVQADVADPIQAAGLVDRANETFGDVSLLVNNAGVQVEHTVVDSSDADWDLVMGINCRGLTRSIAVDHGPNVRCNAISPGWVETAMAADAFALAHDAGKAERDAVARHPLARLGAPADIANAVAWLASQEASFVTGQCIAVGGGMTAASPLRPDLF